MLKVWWVLPLPAAITWGTSLLLVKCAMHLFQFFFFFFSMTSIEAFVYFKENGRALYSTCSIHWGYESLFLDSNSQLLMVQRMNLQPLVKFRFSASPPSVSSVTRQQ